VTAQCCLDHGLDEAADRGWVVVDMREDWNAIFSLSSD
jgi:hypothetical protein